MQKSLPFSLSLSSEVYVQWLLDLCYLKCVPWTSACPCVILEGLWDKQTKWEDTHLKTLMEIWQHNFICNLFYFYCIFQKHQSAVNSNEKIKIKLNPVEYRSFEEHCYRVCDLWAAFSPTKSELSDTWKIGVHKPQTSGGWQYLLIVLRADFYEALTTF